VEGINGLDDYSGTGKKEGGLEEEKSRGVARAWNY